MDCKAISFDILHTTVVMFERFASMIEDVERFARYRFNTQTVECVPLSTCNRLEFYFAVNVEGNGANGVFALPCPATMLQETVRELLTIIAKGTGFSVEELQRFGRFFENKGVVEHLFSTVTGLNSIAIGETQIQGQLKDAYMQAKSEGFARNHLAFVFEAALRAGKRARTETGIDRAQISLGRFAIDSVQNHSGIHKNGNVVILGTGKMAKNGAHYLHNLGIANLTFLSRHPEKRREQLAGFHARVEHLDNLPAHLPSADLVFSAYGTHDILITPELLQPVLQQRNNRLFIIDIGLPRDVDPQVARLSGVELIDFTYLQQLKREKSFRELPKVIEAEKIVGEELRAFEIEERVRGASSLISCFRQRAESIRQEELQKALRRLPNLPAAEQDVISRLTYNIVSKVLRNPTLKIREKAETGELDDNYTRIISEMFN